MKLIMDSSMAIDPSNKVVLCVLGLSIALLAVQLILLCRYLDKKPKTKAGSVPLVLYTIIISLVYALGISIRKSLFFMEGAETLEQIRAILCFSIATYIVILALAFILRFIMLRTRAHHKRKRTKVRKGGTT